MPRDIQTSASAGELDPELHSHIDLAKYRTGLAMCENFFIRAQGGAHSRAGWEYLDEIEDSSSLARCIPFQFNTEQAYALIFTDQKLRVVRNGGIVLESAQNIVSITQANPCVVEITGHLFSNGDDVFLTGILGMTELNGRFFRVANVTANTFELTTYAGVNIDSTSYTAYSSGGTGARVYTIATPYLAADLFGIKYTQSADVMTLMHPDYQQRQLSRTGHASWTLTALSFASAMSPPSAGLGVTQVGTASGSNNKNYRYVVTSVGADGDESAASAIQQSGSINALSETYGNRIAWTTVAGAEYYNVYKEFSLNSGIFGWIGEADEDGSPSFEDYNYGPDMSVTPPINKNPFNGAGDYPSCGTYHQQRQIFGATENDPQTVWGTRTADFDNMDISRPSRADDSLEASLVSQQVNEIRHVLSLDDLLVFTSGGEWRLVGEADGILTPSNLNFRAQGYRGCSHLPPVVIGETALFVQEKNARVRDLYYTFEDDKYVGNDLTVLSRHMFENYQIVDWAYSQEPYSIVWMVRDDGTLLSLTYLREHGVYAFARHVTDGEFESVCSISEGQENVVYAIVKRTIGGSTKRFVERLKERFFVDVEDYFGVDSGLTFEGRTFTISGATQADPVVLTVTGHDFVDGDVFWIQNVEGMTELNGKQYKVSNAAPNTIELHDMQDQDVDGTAFTAYSSGGEARYCATVISNLHHLEGKSVVALADGNAVPAETVVNGEITMPNPAWKVHVGLSYTCTLQTLPIRASNVQGRKKAVAKVWLRVRKTRGLEVGPRLTQLYEFKERTPGLDYADLPAGTAEMEIVLDGAWSPYADFYIRQTYPLPASVLAWIPEVDVSA